MMIENEIVNKLHEKESTELKESIILIVEDNLVNQQVAGELLIQAGFNVEIARNGVEAVELIKKSGIPSKYDYILMDIQMPVMDGYTATEKIRHLKEYDDLPIIALTADTTVEVKRKCLRIGMQGYLTKPLNPDKIFQSLIFCTKNKQKKNLIKQSQKQLLNSGRNNKSTCPDIQGIDMKTGLERIGGNELSFINLLKKFYSNNLDFEEKTVEAENCKNNELTTRLVHSLKGVAGNLGAWQLFSCAEKYEIELKHNRNSPNSRCFKNTVKQLNIILDSIKEKIILNPQKRIKKTLPKEDVLIKLNELAGLLNNCDVDAVKKVRELGVVEGFENEVKQLEFYICHYQSKKALKILLQILDKFSQNK